MAKARRRHSCAWVSSALGMVVHGIDLEGREPVTDGAEVDRG